MDKDQHPATTKSGDQVQSGTATIRKSKRRNRKKKPSTVAGTTTTTTKTTDQVNPPPVPAQVDLKAATAKVLEEVKNVIAQAIPAMEQPKKADEKDRDLVKAEREAKRLAKKNKKGGGAADTTEQATPTVAPPKPIAVTAKKTEQSQKQKAPVAEKKEKAPKVVPNLVKCPTDTEISAKLENLHLSEKKAEKPPLSKAERRAIQEAQRAAKAKAQTEKTAAAAAPVATAKKPATAAAPVKPSPTPKKTPIVKKPATHRVKLFSHLYLDKQSPELLLDTRDGDLPVHPAILQLGVQQSQGTIIGANARCIAFLNALKMVISDFTTPPQKIFSRSLEALIQSSMDHLHKCRPTSVSMTNALKAVKGQINHLPLTETEAQHKETLCEFVDTYIRDQIEKAAVAISKKVQEKISRDDVILTYGCSSLIRHILGEAQRRHVDFRVVVVDSRPLHEGQEMLRRLTAEGIRCSCVAINAVSFVMPEVTKVLVGAHALLANGYVMSRTGTAQVAMVAKSYNVPVLVCCETHKFSERVQTDAFVYNEIGEPNDLVEVNGVARGLGDWQSVPHLTPLNLYYDVTPPELVAAVVTEVAILPCTSVPVILRIKPTEVWY